MKYRAIVILLLTGVLYSHTGFAEPYYPELLAVKVPHLPDAQRQIPADADFSEFDGVLRPENHYLEEAYWIKLKNPENFSYKSDGLVVVNPITLYLLALYIPDTGLDNPLKTVTRFDIDLDPKYSRRSSVFEIPEGFRAGSSLYFYILTTGPQKLNIEYMHRDNYQRIDRRHNVMYSAIFGSLLILIFTNLFVYFSSRNLSYLHYVFYLSAFLYLVMMTTGELYTFRLAEFLADTYPKNLVAYFVLSIASLVFSQSFLQIKQLSARLNQIFNYCTLIFVVLSLIVLSMTFVPPWLITGAQYFILTVMGLLVFAALKSVMAGNPRAVYYLVAFIPLIVMFILRILASIELVPVNRFTINGFQVAIVFQALILSLGLAYDIFINLRERESARIISASTSNILNVEKEFTSFLSRFTDTLTPDNFRSQDDKVVRSFFARLKKVYGISSGALMYESEGERNLIADSDETQGMYEEYLDQHRTRIVNTCKSENVENISDLLSPDDKRLEYFAVPIHNPNLIWCGLLAAVPHYKKLGNPIFNEIHRFSTELVRTFVNLNQLSTSVQYDPLTKVMSRLGILDALERYQNLEPRLNIVLFNISNFKKINRNFGYQAGDSCLLYLVYLLRKGLSQNVKCGRVSSAQFMLIFRNQNPGAVLDYVQSIYTQLDVLTLEEEECELELEYSVVESISPHDTVDNLLADAEQLLSSPDFR